MTERDRPHLRARDTVFHVEGFIERRGFDVDAEPPPFPGDDPKRHIARLQVRLAEALPAESEGTEHGTRLTFESFPEVQLALESMDPRSRGPQPRLDSVRTEYRGGRPVEIATVFVPPKKKQYFIRRFKDYADTLETKDSPSNKTLVESVATVRRTLLRDLWTDPQDLFPSDNDQVWWEVWLNDSRGRALAQLREAVASQESTQIGSLAIGFGSQTVVLLHASLENLSLLDPVLDEVSELRAPAGRVEFVANQSQRAQFEWADSLLARIVDARPDEYPTVCVLDHTVNHTHPLLARFLQEEDVHTAVSDWTQFSSCGHGTEMAALALYQDLEAALASTLPISIEHGLEAVKILPTSQEVSRDKPVLYGAVIAKAVNALEIQDPYQRRVYSLAVTAPHGDPERQTEPSHLGNPTSWSATIDALAAGRQIDDTEESFLYLEREEYQKQRLFVVSAGNIRDLSLQKDHLARNDIETVEDPAQAWNALTVGAYTTKDAVDATGDFAGWTPIAPRGELSPSSRTSIAFDTGKWPVKPDVVAEGGNSAVDALKAEVDTPDELQILTTRHNWNGHGPFTTTGDTSAATASVAALAAKVWANYPDFWPETIRGLVVHSAEWTDAMKQQFTESSSKDHRGRLHRRYGMGVPNLSRALHSAADSLTLVSEEWIQPYKWRDPDKPGPDGNYSGMNLHTLPWPTEDLEALGSRLVSMRVTLSYFVEPNPSARGWRARYAYPSHGLRFRVKNAAENASEFNKRINRLATVKGEEVPRSSEQDRWWFGRQHQQTPGSLHTDIWTGPAAYLASKNVIAVYPVTGWWKYNMKQRHAGPSRVRYSLIVSIEAEGVDVDLWTAVASQIGIEAVTTI